ncbi:uncharacterized protein LOC143462089 [Clavelina lepadiformis]|uniref:C2H2-type domain-containing protein n=1 Tax=Clavelina lepadiformis TaxID=159417 RepID=A0ABP0GKX1_CLALP
MEKLLETNLAHNGNESQWIIIGKLILEQLQSIHKDSVAIGNLILKETQHMREEIVKLRSNFDTLSACDVTSETSCAPLSAGKYLGAESYKDAVVTCKGTDAMTIEEKDLTSTKDDENKPFLSESVLLTMVRSPTPLERNEQANAISNCVIPHSTEFSMHSKYGGRPTMVNNPDFVSLSSTHNFNASENNESDLMPNREEQDYLESGNCISKRNKQRTKRIDIKSSRSPKQIAKKRPSTSKLSNNSNNLRFKCSFCEKNFPSGCSLTRHERIHTGERPYQCHVCPSSFKQKEHLKKHLSTHSKIHS